VPAALRLAPDFPARHSAADCAIPRLHAHDALQGTVAAGDVGAVWLAVLETACRLPFHGACDPVNGAPRRQRPPGARGDSRGTYWRHRFRLVHPRCAFPRGEIASVSLTAKFCTELPLARLIARQWLRAKLTPDQ